jgi:ribose transport system permease protein
MTTVTLKPRRAIANRLTSQVLGEAGIGVALLLLIVFFLAFAQNFASVQNIRDIMTQITLNTILAVGMTFVILVGGIDLSVGSVIALCAVVSGTVLTSDLPVAVALILAVVVAIGIGSFTGLVNGFVSETWKVPSFIVTLGMLYAARGAALDFTNGATIYTLPKVLTDFGTANILGVPAIFLVAVALAAVAWFVLSKTVFGRMTYAIGNNEDAVRLAGHRTSIIKIACFMIGGATVGIAAIVYMARLGVASPILGQGYELNAIAAVVIGGASLFGGRGTILGTFLGACLLGVLSNGLLLLGASDFRRTMITGLVIIGAVILDSYRRKLSVRLSSV